MDILRADGHAARKPAFILMPTRHILRCLGWLTRTWRIWRWRSGTLRERARGRLHLMCLFLHITSEICAHPVPFKAVLTCLRPSNWLKRIIRLIVSNIVLHWSVDHSPNHCHDFLHFLFPCSLKVTGCRCFWCVICASQDWQYVILG